MFSSIVKTRQPFASEFLEAAVAPGREKLANSYLLTGSNTLDMYCLALETARILNCTNKTENCTCNNCAWTRQNRHPAVTTISPIDYIHPNKDGKAKTVITIDQARCLKQSLHVSSQYHRVVIFTDAKEGKEYTTRAERLWGDYKRIISPPVLEGADSERDSWIPMPLSYKIFHSEPANALLKLLEEPPPAVTFFFLTRDKEDMIDTIVSRSQTVPLGYNPEPDRDAGIFNDLFVDFPPKSREEAVLYSEKFMEKAKEYSLEEALSALAEYLILYIKENSSNDRFCRENINRLKHVQKAQQELKNYVNPQAVLDSLMVKISA